MKTGFIDHLSVYFLLFSCTIFVHSVW